MPVNIKFEDWFAFLRYRIAYQLIRLCRCRVYAPRVQLVTIYTTDSTYSVIGATIQRLLSFTSIEKYIAVHTNITASFLKISNLKEETLMYNCKNVP